MTESVPPAISRRMRAVRTRDTKPEMRLRRALHARGLRYRVHPRDVAGKPDVVNRLRRIAVFVDGDFWHANPDVWTRRGMQSMDDLFPPEKRPFWTAKLLRNAERDRAVTTKLEIEGWRVIRVWESEVRGDLETVLARIISAW